MKFICLLVVVIFVGASGFAKEAAKAGKYVYQLKKYEGKKNLLLIFAVEPKDPRFKKMQEGVLGRYADFRKKDIGVFYVFETQTGRADGLKLRPSDAQDLRRTFRVANGEFKVLLIDKAGKIKKQSSEPMTKEDLNVFLGLNT